MNEEKDEFNGLLFINERGYSMHFILLMNDSTECEKLKRRIENRMGCVHTSVEDMSPHSIVLTDLDNMKWKHDKIERFQIGYISACFDKNQILDIQNFLWEVSNIYKRHLEYMTVVFDRVYTWDTIPEEFIMYLNSLKPSSVEIEIESISDSDSDDSFMSTNYTPLRTNTDINKHTREPYSRTEKELIVEYIVEKKAYERIKGCAFWIELESLNICPRRTWQSMKEHSIKVISKEVHTFSFLTQTQRDKLKTGLTKPRRKVE